MGSPPREGSKQKRSLPHAGSQQQPGSSRRCWGRIRRKVEQHFSGWTWCAGWRDGAAPAARRVAMSRFLCWAKCTDPESLLLVGIFIQMITTVGRRTLIIHHCPVNSNRGKQTVLQIGSPGFAPLLYLAGNMGRCWRNRFCSNLSTPKLHKCSIYCARLLNMSKFNLIPVMFHNRYNKKQALEWFSI